MSLDLKHIPCPAGDACTAFQCIFGHARDSPKNRPPDGAGIPVGRGKPPRKRVRVDNEDELMADNAPPAPPGGTSTTAASKPSSPPPPPSRGTQAPTQSPSMSKALHKDKSPARAGNGAPKKKEAPQPKAESLNPRLLKSSPASHETRMKLLRLLHAEYARLNRELRKSTDHDVRNLVMSDQELITLALDEEQSAATTNPAVYSNVMKHMVVRYKRLGHKEYTEERRKAVNKAKGQTDADASAAADLSKKMETGLTPAQDVEILRRILTPITNLSNHGYVPAVPSDEAIDSARRGKEAANGWEKCERCQQRFQVFPGRRAQDGASTSGGTCVFHSGKAYVPTKSGGDTSRPPKRFQCCGESLGESPGCTKRDHHVYKASEAKTLATVLNFAETPPNDAVPADRAVCFDCEMCYTVHGMELVRLTVVSWPAGETLLDVLVQPMGEILDLNSRYSGVWPEDMSRAAPWSGGAGDGGRDGGGRMRIVPSPAVARDLFFSLVAPSTPVMGHGLENDLNSLRVVHPTIVDTVLLYPHRSGLPMRSSLKGLADHHLHLRIQQEAGPASRGHDSAEDARAAGDLIRLKVADEWGRMRRAGWKVVDGRLVEPG